MAQLRIGAHLSIAKGFDQAARQAAELGANTFQFFTRNPRGGKARRIETGEIERFTRRRLEDDIRPVLGHASYVVNLAAADPERRRFAQTAVREDLRRLDELGAEMMVLHPGSHTGDGISTGIERIIEGLKFALSGFEGSTLLLLETMAGAGTEIGGDFSHLEAILSAVADEHLGVCLDTCHLLAAGWEVRTPEGLDEMLTQLDKELGLEHVKAVHLNDSRYDKGERKDRHEALGEGYIGREGLRAILSNPFIAGLPLYLETPTSSYKDYRPQIELARQLAGESL